MASSLGPTWPLKHPPCGPCRFCHQNVRPVSLPNKTHCLIRPARPHKWRQSPRRRRPGQSSHYTDPHGLHAAAAHRHTRPPTTIGILLTRKRYTPTAGGLPERLRNPPQGLLTLCASIPQTDARTSAILCDFLDVRSFSGPRVSSAQSPRGWRGWGLGFSRVL